jgi:GNAT superfamily N-acetyltransferase
METDITYRFMLPGEEDRISNLVASVFNEFIGSGYPPEGVREFTDYIRPGSLRERFLSNHFTLVAARDERIVGMIEVRDESHICLFFVAKDLHGRGLGRTLFEKALEVSRENRPNVAAFDVNSSPNSVGVYERLGFRRVGPEKTLKGITFVPMVLQIKGDGDGR